MPMLDIFKQDAFGLSSLTAAINDQPTIPGRLADMGLFQEEGITTLSVMIERTGDTLSLVPASPRGSSGTPVQGGRRNMLSFATSHLPQRATILADEVQGVRAFGSETEVETVQNLVNNRLAKMRRQLDATIEFHRIGAIKGQILDADGKSVLLDLYHHFQMEQPTFDFKFSDTKKDLRLPCDELEDIVEAALGATFYSGILVLCGKNFWRNFITHDSVKDTYKGTQFAAELRGDLQGRFEFGGLTFERYRGKVGTQGFIGDDQAYAVPLGVQDLFITRFAPADYMETVNTLGLPYYAKQWALEGDKGVVLEAQSNPLNLCTRPGAIVRLSKS